jgi:23S rRNA pseudouridine2605 synthase
MTTEPSGEAPASAAPADKPQEAPRAREASDAKSGERLHKFLASTGAGSRRECETFIEQGRVSVNGKVVTKMGVKVDPDRDVVLLDGERVKPEDKVYYLLHKPAGTISTNSDERGRPRVVDLVRDEAHRIYTVGRLDADSTGLILLTNDGEIANVVCHPRYRIEKTYHVVVRGEVSRDQLTKIEAGVWLAEGRASPARVRPVGRNARRNETLLEITLFEGRNREVRRVFGRVGLPVRRLVRVRLGPLELGALPVGHYMRLSEKDLAFVREAEAMYLANKEAWDAEVPKRPPGMMPSHRRPFPPKRGPSKPFRGGGGGRRFGGGGARREGGGGFRGPGGPPRGPGGFGGGGRRFGGPRPPRSGGGGGPGGWRGPRPDDRPPPRD